MYLIPETDAGDTAEVSEQTRFSSGVIVQKDWISDHASTKTTSEGDNEDPLCSCSRRSYSKVPVFCDSGEFDSDAYWRDPEELSFEYCRNFS